MQSDVVQAIGDLIRSGKADTEMANLTMPGFKVDDIYPIFEKYFSVQAQEVYKNKVHSLLHQRNVLTITGGLAILLKKLGLKSCKNFTDHDVYTRVIDKVCFCASRADQQNLQVAVMKVVRAINDLAARGYITGALTQLSVVRVQMTDNIFPEFVVISYPALTQQGEAYAKTNWSTMFIEETGTPLRFEEQ